MTITLCIIGWLLSGFLAAWVFHVFIDKRECDLPNEVFVTALLFGPFAAAAVLPACVFKMFNGFKPFFKAKEPK